MNDFWVTMESHKTQHEPLPAAATPTATSCRKKKYKEATFLEDLRDHIDDFVNASMDEHKTSFKKTIQKMFGMSKNVAERSVDTKEVESTLPLQTSGKIEHLLRFIGRYLENQTLLPALTN